MDSVMIDRRMKSRIETLTQSENGVCYVRFNDLEDAFWFEDSASLQQFLNEIACERYYAKELRQGYFDYVNEHQETFRYFIESKRGTLTLLKEEAVKTPH